MAYLLLILEERGDRERRSPAEGRAAYDEMLRFAGGLRARGLLRSAEALRSDAEGVRLSARSGKANVLDGPFAESKEMVGGFFLLDCASKAEAVAIARDCPAYRWATIEIRELGPCYE